MAASSSASSTRGVAARRKTRPTASSRRSPAIPTCVSAGGAIAARQVTDAIQRDLRRAELIAFPLVLLLSFWIFRGLVAAFLPPLVGAGAIGLTFLGLRVAVEVHPLSIFALNLVTGLGLGLAIDYSLFVVSRWREEAAQHGHGPEALAATMRSAGRTVFFSALTVAASMACLLVFPQQFLYSMGLGGVLVALAAGLVALLPLPAFLYWLGPHIDALAPRRLQQVPSGGRWGRLAAWVMRRPGRVAAISASFLILLALPALRVHFVGVDATTLPASASSRQVAEALEREDVEGRYSPITALTASRPRMPRRRGSRRRREPPRCCRRGRSRRASGGWTCSRAGRRSRRARSTSSARCGRCCPRRG